MVKSIVERRQECRHSLDPSRSPLSCRILPGGSVELIDISPYGLQVETRLALSPGRVLQLHVCRVSSSYHSVQGRVIRCAVTALACGGGLTFRAGLRVESSLVELLAWFAPSAALRVHSRGLEVSCEGSFALLRDGSP